MKRFSDKENVLLSMVLNVLRAAKTSAGPAEALLQQACCPESVDRRSILIVAAIVQLALAVTRLKPVEILFPGEAPVLFSVVVQKPLRIRKRLNSSSPLWEHLFGKAAVEWVWIGDARQPQASGIALTSSFADTPFGVYFTAYVNGQVAGLTAMSTSASSFDEETIHDARVALRSLLSVFASLKPYLYKSWLREVVPELRRARKILGAVRDADVILGHVREYAARHPSFGEQPDHVRLLAARLEEQRAGSLAAAREYCASDGYRLILGKLSEDLSAKACLPAVNARFKAAPFQLEAIMAATVSQAAQVLPMYDAWIHGLFIPEELLHNMRISLKQLRYLVTFFQDVAEKDGERVIKTCKKFQDMLGKMHDHTVAGGLARGYMAALPAEGGAACADGRIRAYASYCDAEMHRCAMAFAKSWPAGMKELSFLLSKLSA